VQDHADIALALLSWARTSKKRVSAFGAQWIRLVLRCVATVLHRQSPGISTQRDFWFPVYLLI
jgi:hypothetical protein